MQEHERALGSWQTEWPVFSALALTTSGALAAVVEIFAGLEIDGERMRANLDTTRGLIMAEAVTFALAGKIGRQEAHALVEEASRKAVAEKRSLHNVLSGDERVTLHLNAAELGRLFDPLSYQGIAQTYIDRLIASVRMKR
jgi:3-carboxy-cis,cis-muconate cycloisomerase